MPSTSSSGLSTDRRATRALAHGAPGCRRRVDRGPACRFDATRRELERLLARAAQPAVPTARASSISMRTLVRRQGGRLDGTRRRSRERPDRRGESTSPLRWTATSPGCRTCSSRATRGAARLHAPGRKQPLPLRSLGSQHKSQDSPRPGFVYQRPRLGSYRRGARRTPERRPARARVQRLEDLGRAELGRPASLGGSRRLAEEASLRHARLVVTVSDDLRESSSTRRRGGAHRLASERCRCGSVRPGRFRRRGAVRPAQALRHPGRTRSSSRSSVRSGTGTGSRCCARFAAVEHRDWVDDIQLPLRRRRAQCQEFGEIL